MEYSFTHFRFLVQDYKGCLDFYTQILGFHVAWGNENTGYAELDTGAVRLAIFERSKMAKVVGTEGLPFDSSGQDRSTLILRVPNVDEAIELLKEKGVEPITEPQDRPEWGIRTAHIRDPDGNLIEINRRLS